MITSLGLLGGGDASRWWFLALIALVAVERGLELVIATRNRRRLLAQGGVESGSGHYPVMVFLHATLLIAAPAEVFLLERPLIPPVALLCLVAVGMSMVMRYWVIVTLGGRWTTRIVTVPGKPLVAAGPYRWVSHPNYLAVVLEILALPMVHSAWLTAATYTLANALLLRVRIRAEERALAAAVSTPSP